MGDCHADTLLEDASKECGTLQNYFSSDERGLCFAADSLSGFQGKLASVEFDE